MASTAALLPAPDVTKHICDLIHEQLREHAPVSVLCLGFDSLAPIYTGLLAGVERGGRKVSGPFF